MKKVLFSAFALLLLASAALLKPATFNVDVTKSTFRWEGAKVSGKHWGYAKLASGTLTVDNGKVTGGTVEVDMNSIDCQDLQGEWGGKLVGHLKSDDFFSVANNPKATIKIKSITAIAGAPQGGNNSNVVADLTIKGITNEVSFPAAIAVSKTAVSAKADITLDRTKWNIRYGSKSFFNDIGDKAIENNFNVKVDLTASLPAAAAAPVKAAKKATKKN